MKRTVLLVAALAGVLSSLAADGKPAVVASFQNSLSRWTIDSSGCVDSLYERTSGRELVKEKVPFVYYISENGATNVPMACAGGKTRLDFSFVNGGRISLEVSAFNGGWSFRTANSDLRDAASVWFVNLAPACDLYRGQFANAFSDEQSAVFVRGYDAKTEMYCARKDEGVNLCAGAFAKFGFDGHRAGLAVASRAGILQVMRNMAVAGDVPRSPAGGPWAQSSELCRGSYLFATCMDLPSVDDWIALAERGGFDLLHFHVWWKLYGSYEIDETSFPGGLADMKKAADKVRAAGFRVGTHTLSACIEWGSKCLMPVCDTNLISDYTYTLARPFAPGDTELYVNEPIWERQQDVFPADGGPAKGKGNALLVGNELIQYYGVSRERPYRFTKLRRGKFKCVRGEFPVAVGGPYPAGTRVEYLHSVYASFYPKPESPLMDATIARVDEIFNGCDMEELYFDGSEGMGERYAVDRMRERMFRSLRQGKDGIINEASVRNPFHWWFRSRLWPWDHNWYGAKPLHDLHVRTTLKQVVKEDFFATNMGWWAPVTAGRWQRGHFLDEMEYYMCKNAAHDVSMSIQCVYVTDGPLQFGIEKQMTVLGWWERARMARAFAKGLQERMKPEGAEFRLRQNRHGEWQMTPFTTHVHRSGDAYSRSWTVGSQGNRRAELRVEALYGAGGAGGAEPMLKPGARLEVSTAEGVSAEVKDGRDPVHGKTLVLEASNSRADTNGAWVVASESHKYPDLVRVDGAMGCWVKGDGSGALLNLRLRPHRYSSSGICEHYARLDFTGWRYLVFLLRERDAAAFSKMKWDISDNWKKCRSVYNSPLWSGGSIIEKVQVCLNDVPAGGKARVELGELRNLEVTSPVLENPVVTVNGIPYELPFSMAAGDYAELADGAWELFDEQGRPKRRVAIGNMPDLMAGANSLSFAAKDPNARAEVTVFAFDKPCTALRAPADKDHRWLEYEAVMPQVYAPAKGFDAPVNFATRPRERARLGVEIWGPADRPKVAIGGKSWEFPVKLGATDHVVCRDGSKWQAIHIEPGYTREEHGEWYKISSSKRTVIAEGTFAEGFPVVRGETTARISTASRSDEARVNFVKRYIK